MSPSSPRRRLLLWAPVALLLGYEFYLSSQSYLPGPPIAISNFDKLEHAGYYFLMATFAYRALRFGHGWSRWRSVLLAVAAAFAYGIVDEWHQSFVPLRDSDPFDVLADVTGAAIATLVSERLWARLETGSG